MYIGVIFELQKGAEVSPLAVHPGTHQMNQDENTFRHMAQKIRDMFLEMTDIHVLAFFNLYRSSGYPFH